jgi:hypothetical protein
MKEGGLRACLLLITLLLVMACARSVPLTTLAGEQLPASFRPPRGAALRALVTPFDFSPRVRYAVVVDGQPIGALARQSAAVVMLPPGLHTVRAMSGTLQAAVPGQQTVIRVGNAYGCFSGHLELITMDDQQGRPLLEAASG